MARPLKILLIALGSLLLLVVATAVALPLLFDPNDYREQIATEVKKATGRDFRLGQIGLKVFPWVKVRVEDAALGNAEGFGEAPFAAISELDVGIKLLPLLLDRQLEIATVTLRGLRLNLARDANGKTNWDDLAQPAEGETPPAPAPEAADAKQGLPFASLNVEGVRIEDAAIDFTDAAAGNRYQLEQFSLRTGALAIGQPFDLQTRFLARIQEPALNLDVDLQSGVALDMDTQRHALRGLKLVVKANGKQLLAGQDLNTTLTLSGDLAADLAAGTAQLAGLALSAAGVDIGADLAVSGIGSEQMRVQGPLQIARFNPKQLLKALGQEAPATADPQALTGLALQARLGATPTSLKLDDLKIQLDQSSASGSLNVRDFASQAVQFALKVDAFDADRYLPPKGAQAAPAGETSGSSTPINELPLPNAVLDALNVEGTLNLAQLKVSGLTLTDAQVKLAGGKGEIKRQEIAARLYGGSITLNNRFTPGQRNTGSYALSTELKALEAAGFLRDLLGKDYVSGLANVRLDLSGSGATVGDLRRALGGEAGFKVENGAIKGFNLGQSLRKAQAALAGNLNYSEDAPRQTEFGNLSGTARIAQGVLRTETLTGANPQFRLSGSGEIDLFKETINFLAKPTVLDTGSTGSKGLEQLRGLAIPIQLTGNLFDPKVRINLQDVLKAQARDAAGARLDTEKEKVKDQVREKIEEKIGPGVSDLFRGLRKKPQPSPPPAEPAPQQDAAGSS